MTEKIDREIDRLFSEKLLPLAARLKSENVRLLETQLEKGAPSYFVRRPKAAMAKSDFESGGCSSPDRAEAELAGLWAGDGDKALSTLAPAVAQLARSLRQVQEESGDVSNFIYVMY